MGSRSSLEELLLHDLQDVVSMMAGRGCNGGPSNVACTVCWLLARCSSSSRCPCIAVRSVPARLRALTLGRPAAVERALLVFCAGCLRPGGIGRHGAAQWSAAQRRAPRG